jgi:hypothetical protein
MCLYFCTFVFSLQEIDENLTFYDLLKPDNGTYRINQEEFDGFSFVNNGVPSDTLDSQIYSMQESSRGKLRMSYLCHILNAPLFIRWCYEYYSHFSQHQLHS